VLSGTYPDPGFASEPVLESDYDANTVLAANADNTPLALTMGASTVLARLAAGNIKAASVAEMQTLLGIASSGGGYRRASSDQAGVGGTWNQFTGDATDYDTGGVVTAGRVSFTAPVNGVYLVTGVAQADANCIFGIFKNATEQMRTNNNNTYANLTTILALNATDTAGFRFFGAVNIIRTNFVPYSSMELLHAT
jgi:hypothetical protein